MTSGILGLNFSEQKNFPQGMVEGIQYFKSISQHTQNVNTVFEDLQIPLTNEMQEVLCRLLIAIPQSYNRREENIQSFQQEICLMESKWFSAPKILSFFSTQLQCSVFNDSEQGMMIIIYNLHFNIPKTVHSALVLAF